MPVTTEIVVICDCGCGESFRVHKTYRVGDIPQVLPGDWVLLVWGVRKERRYRYFAGPKCLNHWLTGVYPKGVK